MNEAYIESGIDLVPQIINVGISTDSVIPLDAELGTISNLGGTKDYRKLSHKPKINGTELYDNYDEIDPTVPDWAKEENKPTYTPEEVGCVDINAEMPIADVKDIWDMYFTN